MTPYLVCTEKEAGESSPDYNVLPGSFIEDTIGNPWTDPFYWYSADAICGPETTIRDRCCYEFYDGAIACA